MCEAERGTRGLHPNTKNKLASVLACPVTVFERKTGDAVSRATTDEPTPVEGAMHSVWLHGNWRWLTSKMTTPEREAAADAVQRYNDWLKRDIDEPNDDLGKGLRWWR